MTSWVVVDASLLLCTVLPEPYTAKAHVLLMAWGQQGVQMATPALFQYEIVAVLRKHVYRGTLTVPQAEKACDLLLARPAHVMIDETLVRRGYALAAQFNRPSAYDAQYLAVAERLGCEFWTADEKLFNAVKSALAWVKWLGDVTG